MEVKIIKLPRPLHAYQIKKWLNLSIFFTFCHMASFGQTDTIQTGNKEKIKEGFSFGLAPVVAYDSDIGFKYGGLVNFYHYGDGSRYPKYNHSLYLEWSRTTKGSGINQLRYDSDKLIPNTRIISDVSYLTELALDFYGFNGTQSYYNPLFEDKNSSEYISRMYYRIDRKLLRIKADFHINLLSTFVKGILGYTMYNINIGQVNISNLNEGKNGAEILPDTVSLYDKYIDWGFIKEEEKNGGTVGFIKTGLLLDTRDNEPNPNNGLLEEVLFCFAPGFMGSEDKGFVRMTLIHRHYIPIVRDRLSFAYRIAYFDKLTGTIPFYMLSYQNLSFYDRQTLGGAKSIRGMLRNRAIGEDVLFSNFELRWRAMKFSFINQNWYIALTPFFDAGVVTSEYKVKPGNNQEAIDYLALGTEKDKWHYGYGIGVYGALNHNFIAHCNYGRAIRSEDGTTGIYVGMNFIF